MNKKKSEKSGILSIRGVHFVCITKLGCQSPPRMPMSGKEEAVNSSAGGLQESSGR